MLHHSLSRNRFTNSENLGAQNLLMLSFFPPSKALPYIAPWVWFFQNDFQELCWMVNLNVSYVLKIFLPHSFPAGHQKLDLQSWTFSTFLNTHSSVINSSICKIVSLVTLVPYAVSFNFLSFLLLFHSQDLWLYSNTSQVYFLHSPKSSSANPKCMYP